MKYTAKIAIIIVFLFNLVYVSAQEEVLQNVQEPEEETQKEEENQEKNGITLENPIKYEAYYDVATGKYILYPKLGGIVIGEPIMMNTDEYSDYLLSQTFKEYYKEKSRSRDKRDTDASGLSVDNKGLIPTIKVKSKLFEIVFGGNEIVLKPQGFASFDLGLMYQKIDNPLLLPQNRKNTTIDVRQRIQLSLQGSVGQNVHMAINYDTQAGFSFDNRMNLMWKPTDLLNKAREKGGEYLDDKIRGKGSPEDKIIKKIEFGNINMPLSTSLISGSQSLFGVKGEFQFGNTYLTAVFSEQQSEARNIVVQGGGALSTFKVNAIDYEDNMHYFMSQFFRKNYDKALISYPTIRSNVTISKIEVWKIDVGNTDIQGQKTILALRDLGETVDTDSTTVPQNLQNNLYSQVTALPDIREPSKVNEIMLNTATFLPDYNNNPVNYKNGTHYSVHRKVRKLNSSEFKYNPQLGYISLNQKLSNDQLLGVAFQYTANGQIYKVGEFSDENTGLLIVKMLKPNTNVNTTDPVWHLMMKNIYSLEAANVTSENFILNINYKDPSKGKINYLPDTKTDKKTLLSLLNWDRLNRNGDLQKNADNTLGDGSFDYVERLTIDSETGRVIFTKVEPFGGYLNKLGVDNKYIFQELYTKQKSSSELTSNPLSDRYMLEGRFQGEIGEGISLGAINVPRGSVKVTANGQTLQEGADYVVDYMLGRVTIINQSLKDSGVPINISLESQTVFNLQKKRYLGLNLEHKFSDELSAGFTFINYKERSLTHKVQYGAEPVSNTMLGLNMLLNKETPFLTKVANWFPGVKTDTPSSLSFSAEGAILLPGQNSATGGVSYIDDFENSSSRISLKDPEFWGLASKPVSKDTLGKDPQFKYGGAVNDLRTGYGRALTTWYSIDPRFYGIGGGGLDKQALSLHKQRRILYTELFSNKDVVTGDQLYMSTLDVSFFPEERGPYNLNQAIENVENDRWGGLMRPINVTNFTQSNIEYLEFWMMSPYADAEQTGNTSPNALGSNPELIIHLGNVSEDILKDGKLAYENGLPTSSENNEVTTSAWGRQPKNTPLVYTFSGEATKREQDLGIDGWNDDDEILFFGNNWEVNPITKENDPAADNFVFYRSGLWDESAYKSDITHRYKYYRNPQRNSTTSSEMSTGAPSTEDLNGDYNLDEDENYNQYRLKLNKNDLNNSRFVADRKRETVHLPNGRKGEAEWILVRIPVDEFESGSSDNLNNIRYIRMLMKGFNKEATLRFATFDLVRSDWKRYTREIASGTSNTEGTPITPITNINNLILSSVSLEENSKSQPPYVLPPGVGRELLSSATGYSQEQNEASLKMEVTDLENNNPRGVFKQTNLDMRRYDKLSMYVHAENTIMRTATDLDPNAKLFVRMGSDLSDNYYEYEISLKYTSQNARTTAEIWPDENFIEIETQNFVKTKNERDKTTNDLTLRYLSSIGGNPNKQYYVKGRPSLGGITNVMIGIRNMDPVSKKGIIVWVNELKLSGADNETAYAATASIDFNLADFANISASGNYQSVGFGAIDSKTSERSQDETYDYMVNASVNVDKVLPEKWGIKLPVSVNYGESFVDPKYNPLDDDVKFKDDPRKKELKKVVRTYSERRGISVNNFRKERKTNKKAKIYDIENFSLSFTYASDYFRDIYTAYNINKNLRGNLDYSFTPVSKFYEPFKEWKAVHDTTKSAKFLQWFKNMNINPIPSKLNFTTSVDRTYNEYSLRNIDSYLDGTGNNYDYDALYSNQFYFNWQYNVGFNLTKSFKVDYTSSTRTIIDGIGSGRADDNMIWKDLFSSGRPVNYNQKLQLNYKVPINYLPYMDFTSLETAYTAQYDWAASSTAYMEANENLGNTAQNSQIINIVGNLDFDRFYTYFKGYEKYEEKRMKRQRELDSLNTEYSKEIKKGKKPFKNYKFKNKYKTSDYLWMLVSSIKKGQIQYNQNRGAVLPGFLLEPNFFGYGRQNGSKYGPTFGFLFASSFDIRHKAISEGWVSTSEYMNSPYTKTRDNQLTASLQLEPINLLLIDLNFVRNHQMTSYQNGFNQRDVNGNYLTSFVNETRMFNSSIISIGTSFTKGAEIYDNLIKNSKIISQRVAEKNGVLSGPGTDGYVQGFGIANSDVLVPAFVSAFTGKNASSQKLGYKRGFPVPNWNISYGGLKNIPFVSYLAEDIRINHSYVSSYTANGVQSNMNYYDNSGGIDNNGNRYTKYTYGTIVMVEGFSPLIGADVTLRNNMQVRIAYNRDRIYTLGLTNYSLQEDIGNEIVFGLGYIIKNVTLKLRSKTGGEKKISSNINLRGDISIRDNKTTIRRLVENDSQITAGQKLTSIKFSADYNFSQAFNLKFFYEQMITKYKISTAYPLTTIRAGLSATFTFGN